MALLCIHICVFMCVCRNRSGVKVVVKDHTSELLCLKLCPPFLEANGPEIGLTCKHIEECM